MAERIPSISELRKRCQEHKWAKSRGLTRFHRFVSVYVTALMIRTRTTANTITVASILIGLAGSALFLADGQGLRLAGVALLYVSFLLDQVDGEVARYWHATSITGSFLDEIRHILIYAAPVFAVGLRLVMDGASPLVAGAGFASAVCLGLLRFSRNAKYLLVAKKLLAGANGVIQTAPSRHQRESAKAAAGGGRALGRRVFGVLSYVATNQMSLLLLLLFSQLLWPRVGVSHRAFVYVAYSIGLTGITVIDLYGLTRNRLERSCADLMSQLDRQDAYLLPTGSND